MEFLGLDHVEIAMPPGQALRARAFYCGVLGLDEIPAPQSVARRGGIWFKSGGLRLHLGVDSEFIPSQRAHPAIVVSDLQALMDALVEAGRKPRLVAPVRQPTRFTLHDPFGNRLEFVQAGYATPGMALSSAKNLARGPGQQTATRG